MKFHLVAIGLLSFLVGSSVFAHDRYRLYTVHINASPLRSVTAEITVNGMSAPVRGMLSQIVAFDEPDVFFESKEDMVAHAKRTYCDDNLVSESDVYFIVNHREPYVRMGRNTPERVGYLRLRYKKNDEFPLNKYVACPDR